MKLASLAILLTACGGPALQNAPRPNPAAVAGVAAAVAGAATLADPDGAAKRAEENKVEDEKRPKKVKATVPSDVFDRLDQQQQPQHLPPGATPAAAPVPSEP
ncbi:MAG: hypothetical protein ACTHU0_39090 [Kofleriaceae bacterium]